jgi:hypothetical protein
MSMRAVTGWGALLGARLALVYGFVFIVVGVARYGADLNAAPPNGNVWLMYAGGAVSLAVASLGIMLIMALLAALLGAITALCAAGLQRRFGKGAAGARAVTFGLGVAVTVALLLHLVLWQTGLWSWSRLLSTTYLFWLGIPSILYLLAAVLAGRAYCRNEAQQLSA